MKRSKKRRKSLFNEMLGSGALAAGMGEFGEADDDFGGPEGDLDDLGDGDADDDLGDGDADDLGELDEDGGTVTKSELRDAFDSMVEKLFGDGDLDDLGDGDADDLGGLGDDTGDEMGGDLEDDMSGLDDHTDLDDDPFDECMESIQRIAGMLTDDPDILRGPNLKRKD